METDLKNLTAEELMHQLEDIVTINANCTEAMAAWIVEAFRRLEQLEESDKAFDLRWNSDMRAIKRWQEAHPGNDSVWPDHTDLSVWLLKRLEQCEAALPMDTAPRDGTRILVYFKEHGWLTVSWTEGKGIEIWCCDDFKFGPYPIRGYRETSVLGWMPLPAPLDAARAALKEKDS